MDLNLTQDHCEVIIFVGVLLLLFKKSRVTFNVLGRFGTGFELGFVGTTAPIGSVNTNKVAGHAYINNHVRLTVLIHEDAVQYKGYRVVGFEVWYSELDGVVL